MTDKDRYQEMVKSVEGRFSEEWKIEENHILLDHTVMIMHYPKDFTTIPEFFGIKSYLSSVASGNVGKEPVIETDEQMIEGYYRQNQIEMILECALRERSIQVYYQPIYSLKEKELFPSKHWHVCLTGNLDIFHRLNLSRSQKKTVTSYVSARSC